MHYALLQLSPGDPHRDLHHQQCGVAEPLAAQDHQSTGRISQPRGSSEIAVPGATSGGQEMDDADSQLAGRTQPLQHSLAGTDARLGESSVMTTPSFYTDGQGKGHLPLQPHPKNKTKAVYTEELTHLGPYTLVWTDLLHPGL